MPNRHLKNPSVIIYPRPIYVGGTGPAMAPINVLPPDDEGSWVIAETIVFDKIPQYVVHPKGRPVARRAVRKEDILDWVSLRTLEDYEAKEFDKEYEEENKKVEQAEYNKRTRSGRKRRRLFRRHIGSASVAESRDHSDVEMGEASADLFAEDTSIPQQPSLSQPSLSQPSLSQPNLSHKRKYSSSLINNQDTEGTEEDMTDSAVALGSPLTSNISRTDKRKDPTRKAPSHPKDTFSSQEKQNITEAHSKRDRQSRSSDEGDIITAKPTRLARQTGHPSKRNTPILPPPSRTPIRSTGLSPVSRESLGSSRSLRDRSSQPYYGGPTRASRPISVIDSGSPRKIKSATISGRITRSGSSIHTIPTRQLRSSQTPTKSYRYPQRSQSNSTSKTRSHSKGEKSKYFSSPQKSTTPSPSNEKTSKDWPVICLLDDKYRKVKQRRRHFYLVKWAGNYAPTWEPSANVSGYLIEAYKRSKDDAAMADDDTPVANDSERSSQNVDDGESEVQEKVESNGQDSIDELSEESGLFVADEDVKDTGNEVHEKGKSNGENGVDELSEESGLFVTDEDSKDGGNEVHGNGRSRFFSDDQDEGDAGEEPDLPVPKKDVQRGGNKQRVGAFILSSEDEANALPQEADLPVPNEDGQRGRSKMHGHQTRTFFPSSDDEANASPEESYSSAADKGVKEERSDGSELALVPDYHVDGAVEGADRCEPQ